MQSKLCRGLFRVTANRIKACIHFLTDTEGHFPALQKSVEKSRVVTIDSKGCLDFKEGVSNPYFIFGGDLADRGVGDVRLTKTLLDFKNRYPDRVYLLVGNREASKTRFYVELNPKHIRQRLLEGSTPFWLLSKPHQLPIDYVKNDMASQGILEPNDEEMKNFVSLLSIDKCQLIYLKWMLEQTLGCPYTFEYHAQHMASEINCSRSEISDQMVLNHIMEQYAPTGLMGQYLAKTQMIAHIPDTGIIAVHGGLTSENIGRIPSISVDSPRIENAIEWVDKLNQWYTQAVQEWLSLKQESLAFEKNPARSKLDTFSEIVPSPYRSVVTASMLSEQREFQHVPEMVARYLTSSGINMVLTGHQPSGDHPAILRSLNDQVIFVNGDISYANAQANNAHDTRGQAWHCIQIQVDNSRTKLEIDAALLTGKTLNHQLTIEESGVVDKSYIGKVLPGGELVQCHLPESNYYRTIIQEGYKVAYKFRKIAEIESLLNMGGNKPKEEEKVHLVL